MAGDDWRVRVELEEEHGARLLERLGLRETPAGELAGELRDRRLAVSSDADTVFVYCASEAEAAAARAAVEEELAEAAAVVREVHVERWLEAEGRWSDEPPGRTVEEEVLARGYAPWEVRVECRSREEARTLAAELEDEGYGVARTWRYVFAGTATREEAEALARRLHGEVEAGGEVVWEALPQNPFVVFGGLGGSGTPL